MDSSLQQIAKGSIFSRIRQNICNVLPVDLKGNTDALFCILSSSPLNDVASNALSASAQRLGYDLTQIAFITINPRTNPKDLLKAIETIDPLCLIITDINAVKMASAAFNIPLTLGKQDLVLGRKCCCFESFSDMLNNDKDKQRAWTYLKTLPYLIKS